MKSPLQNHQPNLETVGSFVSTVDTYEFSEELIYGYRIFRDLVTQHKKYILPLEGNEINIRLTDDMKVKEKFSFHKVNSNFNNGIYENITQVISDIRMILQNCYRCHGFDHYISKSARTLELVIEQKIALIPRIYREKCTISASNIYWNKEYLNKILYGSRRRSQPLSESSETTLMNQLRTETDLIEREKRKQREEARKLEYEQLKNKLALFEEEEITLEMLRDIKYCWELPCVGIYVYMLREYMNIVEFNYTEFELAAFFMDRSTLYQKMFTALLATPSQRQRIHHLKLLTFHEWSKELSVVVSKWYAMVDKEGQDYTCSLYGISESFFTCLGVDNPLDKEYAFINLSLKQKMCVLKALCESVLESDVSMCNSLATIPILQRQDLYLGQDSEKNTYHFFPQFGTTDVRIYKQHYQTKSAIKAKERQGSDACDYELVVSTIAKLSELIEKIEITKKSKSSHLYDLQQTFEALYEELNKRADSFSKCHEKGKMAVMKDFYAGSNKTGVQNISLAAIETEDIVLSKETNDILEKRNQQRGILTPRAKRLLNRNSDSPVSAIFDMDGLQTQHLIDDKLEGCEKSELVNGYSQDKSAEINYLESVIQGNTSIVQKNLLSDMTIDDHKASVTPENNDPISTTTSDNPGGIESVILDNPDHSSYTKQGLETMEINNENNVTNMDLQHVDQVTEEHVG